MIVLPNAAGKVDLPALMRELGRREINEVHVEAGSKLNGSLIREGCVDELLVYLAPSLIGEAQGMFALGPLRIAWTSASGSNSMRSSRSAKTCASLQESPKIRKYAKCLLESSPLSETSIRSSRWPAAWTPGVRLDIDAGGLSLADVALGDSIAINGACMTVVDKTASGFSRRRLARKPELHRGPGRPRRSQSREGADPGRAPGRPPGVGPRRWPGQVHRFEAVGESWELVIDAPHELAKFLAFKGSMVVNGVSLTVNRVDDIDAGAGQVCRFSINLIPHTIAVTTLKHLPAGARSTSRST